MKIISSQDQYECEIFKVTMDHAVDPDGFQIRRAIVHHSGSAVVMPVDEKGRVLLVRQFRLPARRYLWELPAGRVDRGESVLRGARRELKEETGYVARRWLKLVSYWPSPGFLAEKMTLFVAQDLKGGKADPMEDERIERRWFSLRELDRMIERGEIQDGKTIIGVLAWQRRRKK